MDSAEYVSLLSSYGFSVRFMNEQKSTLEQFQINEIEKNETHNLFCIKTEKVNHETDKR